MTDYDHERWMQMESENRRLNRIVTFFTSLVMAVIGSLVMQLVLIRYG